MPLRNRALILSVLLAVQAGAYYGVAHRTEVRPVVKPLSQFPAVVGEWRSVRDGAITPEETSVLRADDYLLRDYRTASGKSASLFVAYFRSQRAGQTPHSPKNCLPGSGWTWSIADTLPVNVAGRARPVEINRYAVSKGDERAVVLYWYQSRDRVVASEYRAAMFTAWDAIRYNRTDTELVRIVAPDAGSGVDFVQASFPSLQSR